MPTTDVELFQQDSIDIEVELAGAEGHGSAGVPTVSTSTTDTDVNVDLTGVGSQGRAGTLAATGQQQGVGPGAGIHLLWHNASVSALSYSFVQGGMLTKTLDAIVNAGDYANSGAFNFGASLTTRENNILDIGKYGQILFSDKKSADWQQHVWYANDAKALYGADKFENPDWVGAWWTNAGQNVMRGAMEVAFYYYDNELTAGERDQIIGIRVNLNAIAAEGTDPGTTLRDTDHPAWQPSTNPVTSRPPDYTSSLAAQYAGLFYEYVIDTATAGGVVNYPTFFRGRALEEPSQASVRAKMQAAASNNLIGLLATSFDHEPSAGQLNLNIQTMIDYCRNGNNTRSFGEPFGKRPNDDRIWGHWTTLQHEYWTFLCMLHVGCVYLGQRDEYVSNAFNASTAALRAEWLAVMEFGAKYAGYLKRPTESPGAWIAFRQGLNLTGDYSFLMSKLSGSGSAAGTELYAGSGAAQFNQFSDDYVGLPSLRTASNTGGLNLNTSNYGNSNEPRWGTVDGTGQRQSLWARRWSTGQAVRVQLDQDFAIGIDGEDVTVNVHYLDVHAGSIGSVSLFNAPLGTIAFGNTGEWKIFTATRNGANLNVDAFGAHASVSFSGAGTLHMIEVSR